MLIRKMDLGSHSDSLSLKGIVVCKWIFTVKYDSVKYNSDGSIDRYKAQLVVKGFTQSYGVDYQETFAPVAKLTTIRFLLSLTVNFY